MTQIEDIAKLVFKDGMTEEDFFQQIFAELKLRNYAEGLHLSLEETKKWKEKRGTMIVCPYQQEWTKGLIFTQYTSGKIESQKYPAGVIGVITQLYNYRRTIHFPDYPEKLKKEMEKTMDAPSQMDYETQGIGPYFLWRKPKNRWNRDFQDHGYGRFVVNADMNPKLINDLDAFCQKYKCKYKTPDTNEWHKRTDTVNVYLYEPMTDKMKKEFVKVVTPYIRKSLPEQINNLDGDFLAEGITAATEFTQSERMTLIQSAPKHFHSALTQYYEETYTKKDDSGNVIKDKNGEEIIEARIAMSLGHRKVLEEFLDMYKKYAPRLQGKTLTPKTNTTKPPVAPTPKIATPQSQQPIDELTPQRFKDKDGTSGIRYLDKKGEIIITETQHNNCSERIYANGLKMYLWKDSKSITFVDGSKRDKESTEMFVHTKGQGWIKKTQTNGELRRKIEEVRKAGLLLTELPKDKKQPSLLGRLARHSVDNAVKVSSRTGGKISNT